MKKYTIVLLLTLFLFMGCENIVNTPTSIVEDYFSKYQKLDKKVLDDLDRTVKNDNTMNKEQKKEYKAVMEKQYQNLSYKIKNEEEFNKSATIDVEIEVLNYESAVKNAKKYYEKNKNEFNEESYIDYKIKKMKEVNEKIKYEITINLTKNEGIWTIDELNDIDKQKIHGLY